MSSTFTVFGASVSVALLGALLPMQVRDAGQATGTARLSGVVVANDPASTPIRGATVTLTDVSSRLPKQTADTDDDGRFLFVNLPAGHYDVSAVKPAYLKSSFGASMPERMGTPVALADGERFSQAALTLWRGAVIGGQVFDPRRQPLPGITVNARRIQAVSGARTISAAVAGSSTTDDRGFFRIFGLPPGDYVIANPSGAGRGGTPTAAHQVTEDEIQRALRGAGGRGATVGPATPAAAAAPAPAPQPVGYAQVFFPGTPVLREAVPIHVDAGEEHSGVDFALQFVPLATITGAVAPPAARPLAGLQVNVELTARADESGLGMMRGASPGPDGKFTIASVPPGSYALVARASAARTAASVTALPMSWWAAADLQVDGHDVSGAQLTLEPGLTLLGRVVFEGAAPPSATAAGVTIRLTPVSQLLGGVSVQATSATADRTFVIAGVTPGDYVLSATLVPRESPVINWWLKAVAAGGRDVTDRPLRIAPNGSLADTVITFTDRPAEISGVLRDDAGRAALGYSIVAFPTDRALWISGSRRIQQLRPATDGAFMIVGLPAGDYALAAVTNLAPDDLRDPAFLDRLLTPAAVTVTLPSAGKIVKDILVRSGK